MSRPSLRRWLPVLIVSVFMGCGGPLPFFAGGQLDGPTAPTPTDWGFSDEVSTIQIETNPADPYSVNIWAVGVGASLYLHAGDNHTVWIQHLEIDPSIRVRIAGTIYDLAGARVTAEDEYARFADAYEVKYGLRPRNENIAEIYVIRLEAR